MSIMVLFEVARSNRRGFHVAGGDAMHSTARTTPINHPISVPPEISTDVQSDEVAAFRRGLLAGSQRPLTSRAQRRLCQLMWLEREVGLTLADSESDFEFLDARLAVVEKAMEAIERPYRRLIGLGSRLIRSQKAMAASATAERLLRATM